MKTEKFSGQVTQAYGQDLPSPVKFSGAFDAFENIVEIREKNEFPSDDAIVQVVNAKRKAAARAKATTKALDAAGYEKPAADAALTLWRNMVSTLVLAKRSREQAEQIATATLGYSEQEARALDAAKAAAEESEVVTVDSSEPAA